jgi:putative acyl-CoA dehydrogenase
VNCLDVLRAIEKTPESADAVLEEVELAGGNDPRLDRAVGELKDLLADRDEAGARRLVERIAICLQASLIVRSGDAAVADAFCASRLGGDAGRAFGTLPRGVDEAAIVARNTLRL